MATCVLITQPLWVRRCPHMNMALDTNLKLLYDSSDSSLMADLKTILLSQGLGQSPGILTRFVTVNL